MVCAPQGLGSSSRAVTADLLSVFVGPLERLGLTYMVTGGVASVIYGDPRFTRDVDLVLDLDPDRVAGLHAAFPEADFYVPPVEVLLEESQRRPWGHFNFVHHETGLRADIYVHAGDALETWALARRQVLEIAGKAVSFAPPEYVILRKLEYYQSSGSDRHLRDIAMMLRISEASIDRTEVEEWVGRRGLSEEWEAALAFEP